MRGFALIACLLLALGVEAKPERSYRSVTNDFNLIKLSPEQRKTIDGFAADQQASVAYYDRTETPPDAENRWRLFMKFERMMFAELSQAQRERINEAAILRLLPGDLPDRKSRARNLAKGTEAPLAFLNRNGDFFPDP